MDNNPWAHIGDAAKPAAVSFLPIVADDEDEELQKALALSMHTKNSGTTTTAAAIAAPTASCISSSNEFNAAMKDAPPITTSTTKHDLKWPTESTHSISVEKTDNFNCAPFHKLMWDDHITTLNDKERWIYECITTSCTDNTTTKDEKEENGDVAMKSQETSNNNTSSTTTDLLESFTSRQNWGLTQRHGGPCGILAAIQAEMIRVLLWGNKRRPSDGTTAICSEGSRRRTLDYPYSPTNLEAQWDVHYTPPTISEVDEAMAMAIAMILARASIIPAASSEKRSESCTVRLVLPNSSDGIHCNAQPDPSADRTTTINASEEDTNVQSPWIEEMLTSSSNSASSSSKQSGLSIYSIVAALSSSDKVNDDDDSDSSPETKRPRKKAVSFINDNFVHQHKPIPLTPEQIKITNLANAVSDYLLGLNEKMNDGVNNNSSSSSSSFKPLDYFRCPGGVMFFVMSLVESRGIDRIKADMDDPNNTITSQFGHSSQELMNLLLTGQAVSNVFDNSMTLSEELTCRGIQYRPAIGYLSQLESLRYCEVGSYYKSPIFPVWIVASTNHFSVVFGDSNCLQESKSDLLLERCRRAFKKVEDGESGFIMKDSLGKVVEELGLMTMLGDNGVQTLAAYVEVPGGGGIVLWDDFWKATSRLMTGSSLQAIMSDKDDDDVKIIGTINRQATPPPSTMSSDEELARKLAAEWGSMPDDDSLPGLEPPEPLASIESSTQTKPLSLCPPGVDRDVFDSLPLEMQREIIMDRERNMATDDTDTQVAIASESGTLSVPFGPAENRSEDTAIDDTLTKSNLSSISPRADDSLFTDAKKPAAKEPVLLLKDSRAEAPQQKLDFEKHGHTFPLYHYNGLRGGCLTPFRVTRLSAEEAVGASIALSSEGGGDSGGDLQDVVRTKWPSCMFNWLGNQAPYID